MQYMYVYVCTCMYMYVSIALCPDLLIFIQKKDKNMQGRGRVPIKGNRGYTAYCNSKIVKSVKVHTYNDEANFGTRLIVISHIHTYI